MLMSTTETIEGKKIVKHLGLVKGNTIRARHLGRDIMAGLRNIVGGETAEDGINDLIGNIGNIAHFVAIRRKIKMNI